MDVIEKVRQLGAAIQQTEEYKAYASAKEINDKDEALQDMIGQFNLLKMSLDGEFGKENSDKDKIKVMSEQLNDIYAKIMANDSMMKFNEAKQEFDKTMNQVNAIISLTMQGEDPLTCEIPQGCGGSCDSCGGCH